MVPQVSIFPDLVRWRAATDPDRVVLVVDGAGSLTFGEWDSRSNAVARGIEARGVRPGHRVALVFDSARWVDYAVSYVGVQKAGAVAVPLAPRFTDAELAKVFDHCGASAVVCPEDLAPGAAPGWQARPAELEDGQSRDPFQAPVRPTDLADILYTSGTTGMPKGVACSHENVVFDVPPEPVAGRERAAVTFLHAFPIGTNAGQEVLRVPLRRGNTTAITMPAFEPDRFCALIAEHCVMRLQIVPAMAQVILASGAHTRHDTSSVERITLGSAPTPPTLLPRLAAAFPTAELWNVYTLTEAGPARTLMIYDPDRPGAVGKPVWASEVRVVDESGSPQPAGQTGEVWLRREGAPTRSYYRDPEATADTWSGDWLRTGDLGCLDADGYLYLLDRKKDVIISGGFNVSSVEVENALYEHPAVLEAAAFATPHGVLGQGVAAAVALSSPATEPELREFLRERLADYKIPHRITVVQRLPRNASGKVLKRELRDMAVAVNPAPEHLAPRTPLENCIASAWEEVLGIDDVGVNDNFFELGGHSLAAAQVISRIIDALGVELPVTALFEAPTVAELATLAEQEAGPSPAEAGMAGIDG